MPRFKAFPIPRRAWTGRHGAVQLDDEGAGGGGGGESVRILHRAVGDEVGLAAKR